jgi:hypothetical protein
MPPTISVTFGSGAAMAAELNTPAAQARPASHVVARDFCFMTHISLVIGDPATGSLIE